MPTEHVLDDTELLNRLRKLGQGNPTSGFRLLCTYAAVCSVCCQPWRASDGECQCTPTAASRA